MININEIKLLKMSSGENSIKAAYKLLQESLGMNYISFLEFCDNIKDNQVIIKTNNNEVVGVLLFKIQTEKEFFDNYKIINKFDNIKILNLKTIAVKYPKQGIGSELVKHCIDKYKKYVNKFYSPLWKSSNGINAKKLFEHFGFIYVAEVGNYWYEDSIGKNNYCPICNTPCKCSLIVYCKDE